MLFNFKNPLNRKLSEHDLFKSREELIAQGQKGAFIGSSLLDKKGLKLALHPEHITRISGNLDTLAPDLAIRIVGQAIEERRSILLVDFQITEAFWHRFWAISFYFDRANDFRLIDLGDAERSDVLGSGLSTQVAEKYAAQSLHLKNETQSVDVKDHLQKHQGLVALTFCSKAQDTSSCDAFDPEIEMYRQMCWDVLQDWLGLPDILVVFGFDDLSLEKQTRLIEKRQQLRQGKPGLILVQNSFTQTPEGGAFGDPLDIEKVYAGFDSKTDEILFRQRNALPTGMMSDLKNLASQSNLENIWKNLNPSLDKLGDNQCFVKTSERLNFLQTETASGLPWPPDYKPLRSRFAGK